MIVMILIIFISIFTGLLFLMKIEMKMRVKKSNPFNAKIDGINSKVRYLLKTTESSLTNKRYFIISFFLFLIGAMVGSYFKNPLLSVTLSLGLPYLQLQLFIYNSSEIKRVKTEKLEINMSLVTNSYIQSNNIKKAITGSYNRMDQGDVAALPFAKFITCAEFEEDIKRCIKAMQGENSNVHFKQWCDKLILCQDNGNLKHILPFIIDRMRNKRVLNQEMLTECSKCFGDFSKICFLVAALTLIVPLSQSTWRYAVSQTLTGKIISAGVIVIMLLSIGYVVKISSVAGEDT